MAEVIPFEVRVKRLAADLAVEQRREREAVSLSGAPDRTYHDFRTPRRLNEFLVDGEVPDGFEASGKLFPFRVLDDPAMYNVIGEITYTDGRRFLDFGVNPGWVETHSDYRFIAGRSDNPILVCPDCDGLGGDHQRISIPDHGGKALLVKCPRDTRKQSNR